ncbi:hypothetical protein [Pelomonas sp. KK5]|uniref:hypothetical protein n=1 Tax=Pelomonas sp. KK5 TaxID=1855730 RepID=UPI00097C34A7|nr:hypothetical protein [Pelomonas sp. KK5]
MYTLLDAPVTPVSPLESAHGSYFVQKIKVGEDLKGRPRLDVLAQLCAGRKVLHVGCVDWPITDINQSLHLQLDKVCEQLDGFDIHAEVFPQLQPHLKGRLFSDWSQVTDQYDLVLVPEVMEHVGNVEDFLKQLQALKANEYAITVPDAYSCFRRHFDYSCGAQTFVEVVHPDHNCWYTPFTLANTLRKYTDWQLDGMFFFNEMSLLALASTPR